MGPAAPLFGLGAIVLVVLSLLGVAPGSGRPGEGLHEHSAADVREPVVAAAIRADLARRLGVDAADVTFDSYETVTWGDACLGIHLAGTLCAQALTPGFVAQASYEGQSYRYHGSGDHFVAVDFVAALIEEPLSIDGTARSPIRAISDGAGWPASGGRGLIR